MDPCPIPILLTVALNPVLLYLGSSVNEHMEEHDVIADALRPDHSG